MNDEKKPIKIIFAPGCFDTFEGTQDELNELMAEFGISPERTLMVGDTTHDLEMAHNAGCASVAVSYGAHGTAEFSRWKPLAIAHSVRELHDWLIAHG